MESFLPFFLLLFAGVVFSALSQKLHLPWVVALIAAGVVIGPQGFGIVENNEVITFIGEVGLVFLMFMAGLEVKLSSILELRLKVLTLAIAHSIITFGAGFWVGYLLDFGFVLSVLVGIVFNSTSVAVVVPSLEANNLIDTKVGKTILGSTIIADVVALLMLSITLQQIERTATIPLPLLYGILIGVLVALRIALPKIEKFWARFHQKRDLFQQEVRTVLMVMIGTVIILELLGLHAIIAGFFAGLVLSDTVKNDVLLGKLRAVSYGFFIPTFFIVVGLTLDISTLLSGGEALYYTILFTITALLAKMVSGWIGGRLDNFSNHESLLIGAATIPQLSTTLAVVFAATAAGVMHTSIATALVALGVVTTIIGPLIIRTLSRSRNTHFTA